jgi:hypothetical protein
MSNNAERESEIRVSRSSRLFVYTVGYMDMAKREANSRTMNVVQLIAILEDAHDVEVPGEVKTKFWPMGPPLFC